MGAEFYFESDFRLLAFGLLLALVIFGVEVVLRKHLSWWLVLRPAWIFAVFFLLADLTQIVSREVSKPARMIVVYDRSDSVAEIPERRERAENFLKEVEDWMRETGQEVQLFSMAEDLRPETFSEPRWGGLDTRVQVLSALDRQEDSVVALLSDGVFQPRLSLRQTLHAIQLGREAEKDVWIEQYSPVMTAFLRNRLQVPVTLGQANLDGQSLRVDLLRGSQILETKEVTLQGAQQRIEFSIFPERMGEEVYEIRIRELPEELSPLNNQVSFVVRTVRDKIQILHVAGKPSPDLLAWRGFLTRQPDVDLVSFYILRSIEDDPQARGQELSLIPFPYDELFTTELQKFDVVMLQNFNFNLYFQNFYLHNLARFVRDGGALMMIGGDQSFHSYALSPLAPLFPFEYQGGQGRFETGAFRAEPARSHPIVDGLEPLFRHLEWGGRHEIEARESEGLLVQYTDGRPFLSVREVGDGRVLALNTDESWRLQMQSTGDLAFGFGRLARRLLQFLTFDPEMDPIRVQSTPWRLNEVVRLHEVDGRIGDWRIRKTGSSEWDFYREAVSEVEFLVESPGVYEVQFSDLGRSLLFETVEKPWRQEWKHLVSDWERLKLLAENNNGKALRYEERSSVFEPNMRGQELVSSERQAWILSSSSSAWGILLTIFFLFFLDIFFRKKHKWDS